MGGGGISEKRKVVVFAAICLGALLLLAVYQSGSLGSVGGSPSNAASALAKREIGEDHEDHSIGGSTQYTIPSIDIYKIQFHPVVHVSDNPEDNIIDGYQADPIDPDVRATVLLLHGAMYNARTWFDLGTLRLIAEAGYRAVAINLPGAERSKSTTTLEPYELLHYLFKTYPRLGRMTIIVSPSLSGSYSLPYVAELAEKYRSVSAAKSLLGFVSLAPVGVKDFEYRLFDPETHRFDIPGLIMYGEHDSMKNADLPTLENGIPVHETVIIPGAGHACYLDNPDLFHTHLLDFIKEVFTSHRAKRQLEILFS